MRNMSNLEQKRLDKAFDNQVPERYLQLALKKWGDKLSTNEGKLEILQAAKAGDIQAIFILFHNYKRAAAKVFWKYYVGPDKKYAKSKVDSGGFEEIANMAYDMLTDTESNPLNKWDSSKYEKGSDPFVGFAYYFMMYLKSRVFKNLNIDRKGGFSGPMNDEERKGLKVLDYDEYFSNDEVAATLDSYTHDIETKDTVRRFLIKLKDTNELLYKVFVLFMNGKDITQVAEILGVTTMSVRNYRQKMHKMYNDFVGL